MPVTIPSFKVGQKPKLKGEFAATDVPTDPTVITFTIVEPDEDATVTTYVYGTDAQLVRDDVGVYHVFFEIVHAGMHCYSFKGTGACEGLESDKFEALGLCD